MEWQKAEQSGETWKIPASWIGLHYYEALNLLFRIENSVRVFAYSVLKASFGLEWQSCAISTDDAEQTTIASVGKRRLNQAKQFGYLGDISSSPLLYLSLGEVVQLVFSEAYWKCFAEHFPGKRETMRLKLDEIITLRNSLAHFRPLRVDDVEVIRQNAKHALMGIEEYLAALTQCDSTVPSNTTEEWYKSLRPLGSDSFSLDLKESKDGRWVCVRLSCRPPVLKSEIAGGWLDCRVIKVSSPNALLVAPQLRERLVFMTEMSYATVFQGKELRYGKHLNFTFKRDALVADYTSIASGFRDIILTLSEETDLLLSDDLARGRILAAQTIYGHSRTEPNGNQSWNIYSSDLGSPPGEADPPEYWGDMGWFGPEFVTARPKYPWMSTHVSTSFF